ncbi:hypothetical protein CCR75_005681 [Bremia lactucae]|uniref:Uncharacterized protein n=1 Tax=Bremia lactucae TaxID=4779 RepID=A0A976IB66_BRELC|nr:hypothetical protein CCR75_005681 [Bremia lactucae]
MFASSTVGTGATCSNSGSTVIMRGAGSSIDGDVQSTDFYDTTGPQPFNSSESHGELLSTAQNRVHRQYKRTLKASATADGNLMDLVPMPSGCLMYKTRHNKNGQPLIKEIGTDEFLVCPKENMPMSLPHRQQHKQIVLQNRRQAQVPKQKTITIRSSRPHRKDESGVSFQFHGRSGALPLNRSLSLSSSCSTNESLLIRSNSISSTRVSQYSDRVSLETNFGSLHLQSNLSNTGRFIDSRCTPSIQENEEAQALEVLNGWLHASSVSTQDSFMWSR